MLLSPSEMANLLLSNKCEYVDKTVVSVSPILVAICFTLYPISLNRVTWECLNSWVIILLNFDLLIHKSFFLIIFDLDIGFVSPKINISLLNSYIFDASLYNSSNNSITIFGISKEDVAKYTGEEISKKSIDEIAQDVIKGKYGNYPERKTKLESEGYNYSEVQNRVNELIKKDVYLSNANYNGNSIVDALKQINIDSSYLYRSKLAFVNGISCRAEFIIVRQIEKGQLKRV